MRCQSHVRIKRESHRIELFDSSYENKSTLRVHIHIYAGKKKSKKIAFD